MLLLLLVCFYEFIDLAVPISEKSELSRFYSKLASPYVVLFILFEFKNVSLRPADVFSMLELAPGLTSRLVLSA